jgi:hypothetical protein
VEAVARRPPNFAWLGFTDEQVQHVDFLDHLGNNGWARNTQTDAIMPTVMGDLERAGLTITQVKEAMAAIGYGKDALQQLDRWESKRLTGKFGK